jgi:hypothetical protein
MKSREPVIEPRLLDLRQAAQYVGVSYWTLRDWVLAGFVPAIALPGLRPREGERRKHSLRRVLVDRADLDAFIESRKNTSTFRPAIAPSIARTGTK